MTARSGASAARWPEREGVTVAALFRRMRRRDRTSPRVVSAARSHVGRVRAINEDRLLDCAARGLWAVADGMGGHAAGDVAATIAVASLQTLADTHAAIDESGLRDALSDANAAIRAGREGRLRMSGATVVALTLDGDCATVLWAGDSRAYRWRAGRLDRLSRDHSLVQELIDAGTIDDAQAKAHPSAHVVTRALGCAPVVEVDAVTVDVAAGDRLLLCSDGLTGPVSEATIARLLDRAPAPACDALLDAALAAGGPDNVTAVVIAIG